MERRSARLRSVIQRQFGAGVINSYTDFLRGLTARTLDAALAKGTFDFVKEVSADFPINVLPRLLDVPPEDNQRLIDWGNRIIGNTDPDYFDNYFLLLVVAGNETTRHTISHKGSPHLCLGNLLARTEIRIMFEELIPRIADIRLTGEVPRVRSNFVNGIKKLPVEVTLA
jgi:cytochrome P450